MSASSRDKCVSFLFVRTERTRPQREETRRRLLAAAAVVFADRGIGAASIDHIAVAAGFTRGAFYSNFDDKDDLIAAMLEEHLQASVASLEQVLDEPADPSDLLRLLPSQRERRDSAISASPVLYTEYILHAARHEHIRVRLAERLAASRAVVAEALTRLAERLELPLPMPADDAAQLLLAFDDGFGLHMLLDPENATPDIYDSVLGHLVNLWIAAAGIDRSEARQR